MNIPKWINLALSILAFIVVIVRIRYGLKAYGARKSIFGGNKRYLRIGLIANVGYAIVAFLLSAYFLLLYMGSSAATPVFEVMLLLLLVVLIVEATFKHRG
ncbi:MAG TPA: hypothetical protein VGK02_00795 [Candidatus Aquicultor sp.]|jgi:hypothetical protein